LLVLFVERLNIGLAVWIKDRLALLAPGRFQRWRGDVPVGAAFLADRPQILPKLFHCRTAEIPVAVIDLMDDKAGLQHEDVRNHRIVNGIGIFGDVEIFLNDAPGIAEKWPVGADAAAVLIRLGDIVCADGDEPAIADLHLTVELQQAFGVSPIFRAERAAAEDEHHWIIALQLSKPSMPGGMIAQFIVGQNCSGDDVGSHMNASKFERGDGQA
jgi:hypothetical protein